MIEWIIEQPPTTFPPNVHMLGATAANKAKYADCNIAQPTEAGKQIVTKLQKFLQERVPGSGVLQTGYLDAETCAAWRDYTADKTSFMGPYPQNFNINNILDTIDGADVINGQVVHFWECNGPKISPPCDQVPPRVPGGGADPCPTGKKRNEESGQCEDIVCPEGKVLQGNLCVAESCPPGWEVDLMTGDCKQIVCPEGEVFLVETGQCGPIPQPTPTTGRRKGKGVLLLAGAALAAIVAAII